MLLQRLDELIGQQVPAPGAVDRAFIAIEKQLESSGSGTESPEVMGPSLWVL